jgi:endonuclease G
MLIMQFSFNEIRRHSHNKRPPRGAALRMLWMIIIVAGIIFFFVYKSGSFLDTPVLREPQRATIHRQDFEPETRKGKIYRKQNFSLSYVEEFELPEWVAYRLTRDMLNQKKFERDQDFNSDPAISTGSGHYRDYKGSGYRRGHLVPAGDMSWNKEAMDATFLFSNIAPMREVFNDGIWNELEQNVRDWARLHEYVIVITGPVFTDSISTIGENEILVPRYFYKAIFTAEEKEPKVIGFLIDQTAEEYETLEKYEVSIDSIERMTGLDLFSNLYGSWDKEIAMEKARSIAVDWPFNSRWYDQRKRVELEE